MILDWNTCRIVIDDNQTTKTVASALRQLAGLIEDGTTGGFNVVALRTTDGQLVGAATFEHVSRY